MGGPGSSRWVGHAKATTVEDCLVLDVNQLSRGDLLINDGSRSGMLRWRYTSTGEEIASSRYSTDPDGDDLLLDLRYTVRGTHDVRARIRVTTSRLPSGGRRWAGLHDPRPVPGAPAGQTLPALRGGHGARGKTMPLIALDYRDLALAALLLLEEIVFDDEGVPVEFSRNYFIPDYFRFHVVRR